MQPIVPHNTEPLASRNLASLFEADDLDEEAESEEPRALYRAALSWARRGYNVLPRHSSGGKYPAVKWKEFQARRITPKQLLAWHAKFANGVGCVTGAISNLVVIETDGLAGETLLDEFECAHGPLPETLLVTSSRGVHRHYAHPGYRVPTRAHPSLRVDIKGDAGFCMLPPSKHSSGVRYKIAHDAQPAELPHGLLDFIRRAARSRAEHPTSAFGGVGLTGLPDRHSPCVRAPRSIASRSYKRPPVNIRNTGLVQSMLDALPMKYAEEFELWLRTGFALHYFDTGEIGLTLWKRFSGRCLRKAENTNFERRWNTFRDHTGGGVTLAWLRAQAQAHGWRAPCSWDFAETRVEMRAQP